MDFTRLPRPLHRLVLLILLVILATPAKAAEPFRERIVPFIKTYCGDCHNATTHEAELNLLRYDSAEAAADDYRQWEHAITFVSRGEMPPATAKNQPTEDDRAEILKLIRSVLNEQAHKVAGDPGVVLPRRLSNAEYDHSIRDLTGIDIRPTSSFPVDPAAGEGFDNTGEALVTSPSLIGKLYGAAQHVADHALLTTTGLQFAPYPVATFADRMKYCEQAILQFYENHSVDYEVYLTACWQYDRRPAELRDTTLEQWARANRLSPRYLQSLHQALIADPGDAWAMGWLRDRWSELLSTSQVSGNVPAEVKTGIRNLSKDIVRLSKQLCPRETEAIIANAGNGPVLHLERRRKSAAERDTFDLKSIQPSHRISHEYRNIDPQKDLHIVLTTASLVRDQRPDSPEAFVVLKSMNFTTAREDYRTDDAKRNQPLRKLLEEHAPEQRDRLKFGEHPTRGTIDADTCVIPVPGVVDIVIPAKALGAAREIRFYVDAELDRASSKLSAVAVTLSDAPPVAADRSSEIFSASQWLVDPDSPVSREIAASGSEFCRLFPNRFYFVDETRGLSAGFHLIEGVFRDDQPLCRSVLSDEENRELDRLWTELDFITEMTEKMLRGFVFFERSERNFLKHADFDAFKEEDPKLVETDTLNNFERAYFKRSGEKVPEDKIPSHPIHIFFEQIRGGLQQRRDLLNQASPIYLRNLEDLAVAAYRRPLTSSERDDLRSFYNNVAAQPDQGIEQAVRASIVRILMSPYFCCRIDPTPDGDTVRPLGDFALASRLSYFLWSTSPDAELRSLAASGRLQDEQVLRSQAQRMLKDPRVTDFAREFFGQWLGYRHFIDQESVDRDVFKDFDEPLKQAMFEEPTRFATLLIQQDRPISELLSSDLTVLNKRLARHYDIPFKESAGTWAEMSGMREKGRGGILGMAVFLTKYSQPQRTSPVKRGFWVVHHVLGEHIPAPPADVVALPAKETDTNGKTIRELLSMHVEAEKCARCHVRFDSVGLAMEGFDPIGRRRETDLAGRAIDNAVRLADGSTAHGVPEFVSSIVKDRRNDLNRTICRKLLGYALGRSLQLSDDVLLEQMQVTLDKNGDRFVPLFETIVLSPQFRNQRCRDFSLARFRSQNEEKSR